MQPVESSNIKAIGHDPVTGKMRIEFRDGGLYEYSEVQQNTFHAFLKARSQGGYFHARIRGNFNGQRVEAEKKDPTAA
jgi:hypothetical protein